MPIYTADDGAPIRYYDTGGAKPPVIFIHGWTSAGSHWRGVTLALQRRYRCIVPDLRGHGRSPAGDLRGGGELTISRLARDIDGLITRLNLQAPTIVGWSMGGLVTFEYLRRFGHQHLRSVVIVDQTPRLRTDAAWPLGLFGSYTDAHMASFQDLFRADARRVLRRFAMGIMHPQSRVLRFGSWFTSPYRVRTAPAVLQTLAENMAELDYRDLLPTLDLPVLLCYGGASWLYPGPVGEYMRDHLPNATLVKFERSGHCPHFEEPRKFIATLRSFLDAHRERRPVAAAPALA